MRAGIAACQPKKWLDLFGFDLASLLPVQMHRSLWQIHTTKRSSPGRLHVNLPSEDGFHHPNLWTFGVLLEAAQPDWMASWSSFSIWFWPRTGQALANDWHLCLPVISAMFWCLTGTGPSTISSAVARSWALWPQLPASASVFLGSQCCEKVQTSILGRLRNGLESYRLKEADARQKQSLWAAFVSTRCFRD